MNTRRLLAAAAGAAFVLGVGSAQTSATPSLHGGAPAVSPVGSSIAFLSDRDGATDVYVISADGTGERRLTRTAEVEGAPAWSTDGKDVWFSVFADGSTHLYSVPAGGGDRKLLGTVPGRAMRVSPDGKRVLRWEGTWTAMKLFASDLDGSSARQLTDGSGVAWGARWSPDAKSIAFGDNDANRVVQVHVIAADGSGRRQVTHFSASDGGAQMPAWSPDRGKLAVQAGPREKPSHIWVVDLSGGAARKIAAHEEPWKDEVPFWFPDGKRLAFQSDRTGRMEIWTMNADGTVPRQVTR